MKKKGFTLVELIGTIVIISLISLLIVPKVKGLVEKEKKKLYNSQLKIVMNSVRNYVIDGNVDLEESKLGKIIYISDLYDKGYLNKKDVVDPTSGKSYDKCVEVRWDDSTNQYNYTYDDDCEVGTHRACFAFNKKNNTITDYYDYENNDNTQPACPRDVEIPRIMDGVEVKKISDNAFSSKNLKSIILPDTLRSFGIYAFTYNHLKTIEIPEGVTSISDASLAYNELVDIKLPSTLKYIGAGSLYINRLKSVDIPEGVTTIDCNAFQNNALTSITIPNTVTMIQHWAFANNQIQNVEIPDSVKYILYSAFINNRISSLKIGSGVTTIDFNAFQNNRLTEVTIPSNVKTIGSSAFQNNALTNVVIPNSITKIEDNTFAYNKLQHIDIPNSITSIGSGAFRNNLLTKFNIPTAVTSVGSLAFYHNQLTDINLHSNINKIGAGVVNVNNLPEDKAYVYARNEDGTENKTIFESYGGSKRDITLEPGIIEFAPYSLESSNFTSITIPEGVKTIRKGTFYSNSLSKFNIPKSVNVIESDVFSYNGNLKEITVNTPENCIEGSPWGATNATITYNGTECNKDTYTNLEYIESSGNQFINTGFIPNQDTSIELGLEFTKTDRNQSIFMSRSDYSSNVFSSLFINPSGLTYGYNTTTKDIKKINNNIRYKIYVNKNKYYIDDELVGTSDYINFTSTGSIYLMSSYRKPYTNFDNYAYYKLYYVKIWDNDKLVRDMIPAKNSNSVFGLYDKLNDKFYTNRGSGLLIPGPEL